MNGRSCFNNFNGIINAVASIIAIFPYGLRYSMFKMSSGIGGHMGELIRYLLFCKLIKKCGTNVIIKRHVFLYDIREMVCGNNVSIHEMCYINGCGGLLIGNDVSIAHGTSILTTNHTWSDLSVPIKYNKVKCQPVNICDDVWIGCGAKILAGVTINERSVVAAGSIITKDVISNTLVGGCPAKVIKKLSSSNKK